MTEVQIAVGWKEIAQVLYTSERSAKLRRKELLDSGTVFETRRGRGKKKRICAYVDVLKAYRMRKQAKGERF